MRTLIPLALYVVDTPDELVDATREAGESIGMFIADDDVLINDYALYTPPREHIKYPTLISVICNAGDEYVQISHFPMKDL